jgi:GT2 family glycosyltransferase
VNIHIAVLTMGNQANIDRLFSDLFWSSVWGRVTSIHVLSQSNQFVVLDKPFSAYPALRLHKSESNLGCAGGRKFLTERIMRMRYICEAFSAEDVIVYLDDDIEVLAQDWLMKLVEPLLKGQSISGVAGRDLTPDLMTVPAHHAVDYVSGGWCAIRGDVFLDGCMFDEQFNPNYFEDVDFCFQAREKSKSIYVVGDIGLRHEHLAGASAAGLIEENRLKFGMKWGLL